MDIKILVATHKPYWMPDEQMYVPIHVGHEAGEGWGYIGDDTGEHISGKNSLYCELTGLYWAWKNMKADYIGLVHYRRYFMNKKTPFFKQGRRDYIANESDFTHILKGTDIIVPEKRRYYIESVGSQFNHAHDPRLLDMAGEIISEQYPQYKEAFDQLYIRTWAHMFNMFVMKYEKFDAYCTWLFDILFDLESRLGSVEPRSFGFLSERLLDVWLEANHYSYKEVPIAFMENQNWGLKIGRFLKRKFTVSS